MRVLLILIVVLALLPLSDAIKCYEKDDDDKKVEEENCKNSDFCLKKGTKKGCGKEKCKKEGCHDNGICCCKGDFCNPAAGPTALFSLAAAAAMAAARV